jgi:large subunit ribosomal protein L18
MRLQAERRKLRRRYALKQRNYKNLPRLCIFRSCKNMSVQIIDDKKGHTLVASSSLEKEFKASGNKGYNLSGAQELGKLIAVRALKHQIKNVVFDIGAYKYHGKVKMIIESAINNGLNKG